ncbi:MAG: CPBP family intramembrane metalloprotease [Holophagae bacterium]|nr:MAG: CPBP family intramembrane metalloprotease [Holophagae bacterium]
MARTPADRKPVSAVIALLLLAPVPTVGVAAALHAAPGTAGRVVFGAAKLWLLLFPAAWYLVIQRGRPSWSPPARGGLGVGAAVGAAMAAVVVGAFWVVLRGQIDPLPVRQAAAEMGLAAPAAYLAGAVSWILFNSLAEEYVWRWFVLEQLRSLLPGSLAVAGSAALFAVHHTVAMAAYLGTPQVVLGSLAVLLAGACWSLLYLRYDSIWPGWISHVVADIAVFVIGWQLLFSRTPFDG